MVCAAWTRSKNSHCQGFSGVVIAVCHQDWTGRASPTAGRSLLKSVYKSWLRYENLPELLRCLLWESWLFLQKGPVLCVLLTVHLAAKPFLIADTIRGLFSHWGAGSECRLAGPALDGVLPCWVLPCWGHISPEGVRQRKITVILGQAVNPIAKVTHCCVTLFRGPFQTIASDGQQHWLPLLLVSLVGWC